MVYYFFTIFCCLRNSANISPRYVLFSVTKIISYLWLEFFDNWSQIQNRNSEWDKCAPWHVVTWEKSQCPAWCFLILRASLGLKACVFVLRGASWCDTRHGRPKVCPPIPKQHLRDRPRQMTKRCNILAVVEIRTPTMTQTWIRSIILREVGRRRAGIHR